MKTLYILYHIIRCMHVFTKIAVHKIWNLYFTLDETACDLWPLTLIFAHLQSIAGKSITKPGRQVVKVPCLVVEGVLKENKIWHYFCNYFSRMKERLSYISKVHPEVYIEINRSIGNDIGLQQDLLCIIFLWKKYTESTNAHRGTLASKM